MPQQLTLRKEGFAAPGRIAPKNWDDERRILERQGQGKREAEEMRAASERRAEARPKKIEQKRGAERGGRRGLGKKGRGEEGFTGSEFREEQPGRDGEGMSAGPRHELLLEIGVSAWQSVCSDLIYLV